MERLTAEQFIEWWTMTEEVPRRRVRSAPFSADPVPVPVQYDSERLRAEVLWRE